MAYIDWSGQEIGIAAALSGDTALMAAYQSGDPYLMFGKQAGQIPPDGTEETHAKERALCKICVLGIGYGMEAPRLALHINQPLPYAVDLLRSHREIYRTFWDWSDAAMMCGVSLRRIHTVFGWALHTTHKTKTRTLRNFPAQANGAEMMRVACCLATEQGINVCAPIHDALLIEASIDEIDDAVERTQDAMARASEIVLGGFRLRTGRTVVRWPDRYMDKRGKEFWMRVMSMLPEESVHAPARGRFRPIPNTYDEETGQVRGWTDWAGAF
jgi:DNA polymerase I-like protein with 3'-5' exonuclease and polymerase domains